MAKSADLFLTISNAYQKGEMDNNLDLVFSVAASSGFVLLPGSDRAFVKAKCDNYDVADLLLPYDRKTWHSITIAYKGGMDVYPNWFTWNDRGYFDFTQEAFLQAFIKAQNLTKYRGKYLMDGKPITKNEIKKALMRSLAIVRADAGSQVYGMFTALEIMVDDDESAVQNGRLSCVALADEMNSRGYGVKYNVITTAFEVIGKTASGRPMNLDDLETTLYDCLSPTYKGCSYEILRNYISFIGRENRYNPVLDLLSATAWDGKDRLPDLYSLIGIPEDDQFSKVLVRKWLLQAVALLFNDTSHPFGADGCLVLLGRQGDGKTSFLRYLALKAEWFGEGLCIDDHDKDTLRRVVTNWISELGEVERTLKSDISKLKAFVTDPVDHYRLPYGRRDKVEPRHTSLAATCNSNLYLIDPTGNRRWWTVPFTSVNTFERLLTFDPLQLWAQIYSFVAPMPYTEKGSCFRLTREEQELLAIRNSSYEKPCKGKDEVEDIIEQAKYKDLTWSLMTTTEFIEMWPTLHKYSAQQIGIALTECGIEVDREHGTGKRLRYLPTPFKTPIPY